MCANKKSEQNKTKREDKLKTNWKQYWRQIEQIEDKLKTHWRHIEEIEDNIEDKLIKLWDIKTKNSKNWQPNMYLKK